MKYHVVIKHVPETGIDLHYDKDGQSRFSAYTAHKIYEEYKSQGVAALYTTLDPDDILQCYYDVIDLARRGVLVKSNPAPMAKSTKIAIEDGKPNVTIYTDGACSGNPGPGGWGAILECGDLRKEFHGHEDHTTNNRMELMGAIGGLSALKKASKVTLYSDSAYVVNAFQKDWISGWKAKGWINSKKQPVENKDLWEQLLELTSKHEVTFVKVAGHAGDPMNERCDQIAKAAVKEVI